MKRRPEDRPFLPEGNRPYRQRKPLKETPHSKL